MKKLFDKIKKNNKGFTLVELIVVVAILAVITVVVAPQYLSYVEKSRIGTDENTIGEIAHVAEISFVELKANNNDYTAPDVTVKIEEGGSFDISSTDDDEKLAAEIKKVITTDQYTFKSEYYAKEGKEVTIELSDKGIASWDKADGTTMGGTQ